MNQQKNPFQSLWHIPSSEACKSFIFWSRSCEGRNPEPVWSLGSGSPGAAVGAGSFTRLSPNTAAHSLLNSPSSREEALKISLNSSRSSLSAPSGSRVPAIGPRQADQSNRTRNISPPRAQALGNKCSGGWDGTDQVMARFFKKLIKI